MPVWALEKDKLLKKSVLIDICLVITVVVTGCAAQRPPPAQMEAAFSKMSPGGFHISSTAPSNQILPYSICKAVWFAEKSHSATIGISPALVRPAAVANWATLETDVAINPASPQPSNLVVTIDEVAGACRKTWDW